MFPNRMDPARAKATSERVLRRLTDPLIERSIDPVMGTSRPRTVDSEGLHRASELAHGAERGLNRPTIPAISREPLEVSARTPAERFTSGEPAPSHQAESPRIRVDIRIGVSFEEIEESIVRQVYELEGTQLRTASALGITPDTVSRIMRRSARRTFFPPQVPKARRVVRISDTDPSIGTSGDRINTEELGSLTTIVPFTRNPGEAESAPLAPGHAQASANYE